MTRFSTLAAFFIAMLTLTVPNWAKAQSSDEVFSQLETAIRSGDANGLARFLNKTVELTIVDSDQDYARAQAQFVLKEFFQSYPVKSFSLVHRGNSGDTYYSVGSYVSGRGTFNTTIYMKKYGTQYLVDTIRFERSDD